MRIFVIISAVCVMLFDAGATVTAATDTSASSQFEKAYETLQSADTARDGDKVAEAVNLYREALTQYMGLSRRYPSWSSGVVKFRIAYCNNQLDALLKKVDISAVPSTTNSVEAVGSEVDGSGLEKTPLSTQGVAMEREPVNIAKIKSDAESLLESGDAEQARSVLMEGLRADPDNQSLRLMTGIVQCQAGMFTDAVYLLAQLVRESPSNTVAHLALGAACFGLGKIDDATKEVKRALELNPNLAEAHYDISQLLRLSAPPDTEGAVEQYRKSLDLGGKPDTELNLLFGDRGTAEGGAVAPATTAREN